MKGAAFRGWVKVSLLEYPGRVATVVFTGGCNLRCPYCHNADLVLDPERLPEIDARTVLTWIEQKRGLLGALVVTGGEPTIHPWLGGFLAQARGSGVALALCTNGTRPDVLQDLLEEHLLDRVCLDVKTHLDSAAYAAVSGVADPTTADRVRRSFEVLRTWGGDYELRCTVVRGHHDETALRSLVAQVAGARRLVFQRAQAARTLDPACEKGLALDPGLLETIRGEAESSVQVCTVR